MASAVAPACNRHFLAVPPIAELTGCVDLVWREKIQRAAQYRGCPVRKMAMD